MNREGAVGELTPSDAAQPETLPVYVETVHDFGVVRPQTTLEHSFPITNDSKKPWHVKDLTASCGCTVPRLSTKLLLPGEQLYVHVTYGSGPRILDQSGMVLVRFYESDAPCVRLHVKARVRDVIFAVPAKIDFPTVFEEKRLSAVFEVLNYSEQDWEGIDVQSPEPSIRASILPYLSGLSSAEAEGPLQSWRVLLDLDTSGFLPGTHERMLTVNATGAKHGPLFVPIHLAVGRPITVTPSQLVFDSVTEHSRLERKVTLAFAPSSAPRDSRGIEVRTCGLPMTVAIDQRTPSVYILTVSVGPVAGDRIQSGKICVSAQHIRGGEVVIPCLLRTSGGS